MISNNVLSVLQQESLHILLIGLSIYRGKNLFQLSLKITISSGSCKANRKVLMVEYR